MKDMKGHACGNRKGAGKRKGTGGLPKVRQGGVRFLVLLQICPSGQRRVREGTGLMGSKICGYCKQMQLP